MTADAFRKRAFTRRWAILLAWATLPIADSIAAPPFYRSAAETGHREERVPPPGRDAVAASAALPRVPARDVPFGGLISVQVNTDASGNDIMGDAANEPSIAIDPTNPDRIVIAWRQFDTIADNFRQAGVAYSDDGGATWTNVGPLEPGVFHSDPVLGADNNGTFFFMSLSDLNSMELFRSYDGGVTWGSPVPAFGGDKEWMTVDTTGGIGDGNIYAVWNTQFSCCGTADFTRSTDGGAGFETPIDMPDPRLKWGMMDVGPDGELYLAGATLDQSGHVFARALQPYSLGPVTFDLVQPFDFGGVTTFGGGVNPAGILGQINIATDDSALPTRGNIYVLASVTPAVGDPVDVHFVRSLNGGESFSEPVRVNDDSTSNGASQWLGTLSVAPNGRIDAVWLDTRNDATPDTPTTSELYYACSFDAGFTWSPNTVLSPPFEHGLGYPSQDKMGDYFGMISDNGGANVAYAATFNGGQDVYFLRIPADCNNNGVPDDEDVLVGGLPDCNGNLVPDECESTNDCNGNSTPDLCELAAGITVDCNRNLILDECESAADCNANGVPDECEPDCNHNGIADDCDISSGTSLDVNQNGIPDECEIVTECPPLSWTQRIITTDTIQPLSVFAADLDGDGDADALSASFRDDTVAWYENMDGLGTFGPKRIITSSAITPGAVVAADLDGDGDMDVVADGPLPESLAWYENTDGLGTFAPAQVFTTTADNVLALSTPDLNGDGRPDVLSSSRADDKVAWYENIGGAGVLGSQQIISTAIAQPLSAFAADLDGDHDIDVMSAGFEDGTIAWYENLDGLGTFGTPRIVSTIASTAYDVVAGDIDGDGDTDMVAAVSTPYPYSSIVWFENTDGGGSFGPERPIQSSNATSLSIVDLDRDGDLDIVYAASAADLIAWVENTDGLGNFRLPYVIATGVDGAGSPFPADLDGDGDWDLLSVAVYGDTVAWHQNVTADCNGNGLPDSCDIQFNLSTDCDGNGIPDECDTDCNGNGVPDPCDVASGTSPDIDGDGIPDECGFSVPGPVIDGTGTAKTNRYLLFEAPLPVNIAGNVAEVVRLRVVSLDGFAVPDPDVLYVGPPRNVPEEDMSQPGLTFVAAPLQCAAYAHPWGNAGVVAAYGAEIIPGSTYELQRAFEACPYATDPTCWSTPTSITTARFGDVVPLFAGPSTPPQPDFNDINAMVQKFLARPGAPHKAVAQLQPNVVFPERSIDFRDIASDVDAFIGASYSSLSDITGPCMCPSSVTCGATTCTSDLVCGGGYCIDGACTDACGRCTP